MRLVVKVESAGKKVCDLRVVGLLPQGKLLAQLIPQVSRQGGPAGSFQPSFQRERAREGCGFVFLGFVPARGCSPEIRAGYCCRVSIRDIRRNET